MPTGPVTVAEVRARLGGAPSATDDDLQIAVDVATAHIAPTLDPEWADPATWPDDLHDGVLIGSVSDLAQHRIADPGRGRRKRGPGRTADRMG